jgi:hypothetical protein
MIARGSVEFYERKSWKMERSKTELRAAEGKRKDRNESRAEGKGGG